MLPFASLGAGPGIGAIGAAEFDGVVIHNEFSGEVAPPVSSQGGFRSKYQYCKENLRPDLYHHRVEFVNRDVLFWRLKRVPERVEILNTLESRGPPQPPPGLWCCLGLTGNTWHCHSDKR